MTDTTISDAVVFPQDEGTGVSDGSEDYDSAAYFSLISRYKGDSTYVGEDASGSAQLQFNDVDQNNNQVDVGSGHAFINEASQSVQEGSQTGYNTTLPVETPTVVILPSEVVDLPLASSAVNDVWLAFGPANQDDVFIRSGSGLSSPSNPSVKLGTVDTSDGSTTRPNDLAQITTASVETTDQGSDPSSDGVIQQNNGDVKIHSGGSARNASNIGAGGATTEIETQSPSGVSTADFTTGIDSDHQRYVLHLSDVVPASDSVALLIRVSADGGSTWESGSSAYAYSRGFVGESGNTGGNGSGSSDAIEPAADVGSDAGEALAGFIGVSNPANGNIPTLFYYSISQVLSSGAFTHQRGGGRYLTAESVDGLRIRFSSGNIESGEIALNGGN